MWTVALHAPAPGATGTWNDMPVTPTMTAGQRIVFNDFAIRIVNPDIAVRLQRAVRRHSLVPSQSDSDRRRRS